MVYACPVIADDATTLIVSAGRSLENRRCKCHVQPPALFNFPFKQSDHIRITFDLRNVQCRFAALEARMRVLVLRDKWALGSGDKLTQSPPHVIFHGRV